MRDTPNARRENRANAYAAHEKSSTRTAGGFGKRQNRCRWACNAAPHTSLDFILSIYQYLRMSTARTTDILANDQYAPSGNRFSSATNENMQMSENFGRLLSSPYCPRHLLLVSEYLWRTSLLPKRICCRPDIRVRRAVIIKFEVFFFRLPFIFLTYFVELAFEDSPTASSKSTTVGMQK